MPLGHLAFQGCYDLRAPLADLLRAVATPFPKTLRTHRTPPRLTASRTASAVSALRAVAPRGFRRLSVPRCGSRIWREPDLLSVEYERLNLAEKRDGRAWLCSSVMNRERTMPVKYPYRRPS